MQQRPPIYLVDATECQVSALETVLHFVGESYQSVSFELLRKQVSELNPLCVIYGGPDHQFASLLHDLPKTALISLSGQVAATDSNHIGVLRLPIVYSELTQLLHYCQAFINPNHKLNKANKYLWLI